MEYNFRAIARNKGGIEGLLEVMSTYELTEGQPLSDNNNARNLFLAIAKKMDSSGHIRLGDFPHAEAIKTSLAVDNMEYVGGICFMCVVAAGWQVLRSINAPITDALPDKHHPPTYLAGMTLGIFGGLSWEYGNIDHYGDSEASECLYNDFPPDFVADVLTSDGYNRGPGSLEDPNHPFYGRITNLLPNFIDGPSNQWLHHKTHLQHMFVRLHCELSGPTQEAIEPARTIADKMFFRFSKTLTPEERLAMMAHGFAGSIPEHGTP